MTTVDFAYQKKDSAPRMEQIFISLGSNLGDRMRHLRLGVEGLKAFTTVVRVSSAYESEPVEYTAQPWFLNAVVCLHTKLEPEALLASLLELERLLGRDRSRQAIPKGPRVLDLDLIAYGERRVDTPTLTLPHPAFDRRRFVLQPLAEIAPAWRHPVLGATAAELLRALPAGVDQVRYYGAIEGEDEPAK
jgi:2-amino-4-hydroxy-6-hydroxymethyldihydropteridine diphosphokinase